jgi:ribosomal protein S12 methylthiotransferase
VVSLGCSKNLVDTEVMLAALTDAGCEMIEDPSHADAILVNTCAFLTEAVEEALDRIVELAGHKKTGRARRLVVAGCLVSRYGKKLLTEVPEIDALVHPRDIGAVARAVLGGAAGDTGGAPSSKPAGASGVVFPGASGGDVAPPFPPRVLATPPHRAYLKIAEGCANRCSYCLIPALRGDFVSRPSASLVEEMRHLAGSGVREITLVSQDSTRYVSEIGADGLARLLRELVQVPGSWWLRALYTHPARVSDGLLDAFNFDPRICRYLDVPFQHVSPSILAAMNRSETPDPLAFLRRVRERLPGVFLRTTLMVGFPGESDEDFDSLLSFVEAARFDHLGAFVYSPEEGTPAFEMEPQVDEDLARERLDRLMMLQGEISAEKLSAMVGQEMTVLSEGPDPDGVPVGRHAGQAPEVDGVVELDRPVPPGEFVRVRITASDVHDLAGMVL